MMVFAAFYGCQKTESAYKVDNYGVLREIMMENKLDTWIDLKGFQNTENLYALGAVKGLAGEIMIVNGQPIISKTVNGEISIQNDFNQNAILLVYAQVEAWDELSLETEISDLMSLQTSLKAIAEKNGLDTSVPFPFLIEGDFTEIKWHIINASEATEANHDAYKKAGISGHSFNETGKILGFYSENHEGVFTHHGSYLHAHYVNDSITKMGHVDEIVIRSPLKLSLPKSSLQ
jgi:acetolactate decarboxylase